MHKSFLLALLCLLLPLSTAAQEINVDVVLNKIIINRCVQIVFENDPSGFFMTALVNDGEMLFPGSKKEFGFTDEQRQRLDEYTQDVMERSREELNSKMPSEAIVKRMRETADYTLTEDEDTALTSAIRDMFNITNESAVEVFTNEQIQKMDGMMLAMTGALESPFFNDRHMNALDMTDEQKAQFKKINDETKPERDKMMAAISETMEKIASTGKFEIKDITTTISKFREYQKTLKKRRMEVLTEAQIAKAAKLAKAPKFMSVANLLPTWTPSADSWKPGDPVPAGAVPPRTPGNFPRLQN